MPLQDGDLLLVNRSNQSFRETFANLRSQIPGAVNSDTAPATPIEGDLWFNTDDGHLYVFYNDGATSQWVDVSLVGGGGGGDPFPPQIEVDPTAPEPSMTIDAAGRLLVGTGDSVIGVRNQQRTLQVARGAGATQQGIGLFHFDAGGQPPNLEIGLSKDNTIGAHGTTALNDSCGNIIWSGSNGTEFEQIAQISGVVDGAPSATSSAGRLVFSTTPDGSITPVERMTIQNNGSIAVQNGANVIFRPGSGGIAFLNGRTCPAGDTGATADDNQTLGQGTIRWAEVFAVNDTINTSDENQKEQIKPISDAELRVASALSQLVVSFKWKSAVKKKSKDARIHIGVIAQQVEAAFAAEGLDAHDYALFCEDELEDGSGSVKGVRYSELQSFLFAATAAKLASLEQRLASLEGGVK